MHLPMRSGRRGRRPSRLTAQKMGASEEAPFITATRREDLRLGDLAAAGGDQRGHTQREQRRRGVRGNWHRHLHCSDRLTIIDR